MAELDTTFFRTIIQSKEPLHRIGEPGFLKSSFSIVRISG
jgi:hypothetical protein